MKIGGNIIYRTRAVQLSTLRVVILRYSRPDCSFSIQIVHLGVCEEACFTLADSNN